MIGRRNTEVAETTNVHALFGQGQDDEANSATCGPAVHNAEKLGEEERPSRIFVSPRPPLQDVVERRVRCEPPSVSKLVTFLASWRRYRSTVD